MKKFVFLFALAALLMGAVTAQTVHRKTSTYHSYVNVNADEKTIVTFSTTDSILTTADSIVIASNSVGLVEVNVIGYSDSLNAAVTGRAIARYKKPSGTLTLATPTDISAAVTDAALGTATYSITTSGNNIVIKVKGKLDVPVKWYITVTRRAIVRSS